MAIELWVEKYRPKTVSDYVFRDDRLKKQVASWIKEKSIPHLLLSGAAGTGKSSLARVLINEIGIDGGDILYINASDATGVDVVRSQIQTFVSTISLGDFKVVLLEEFDHMSPNAQAALRRVMEDYADASRFILTCNYANKIIPAIKSRCQEIILQSLDIDAFKIRMIEILLSESVEFSSEEVLDTYIKASFPDLRKCINMMQQNTQDKLLLDPDSNDVSTADWQIKAIDLFKKGSISEARKLIASQIRQEEYEDFYKLCYQNLDWWSKTEEGQDEAIVIIRDSLVKHTMSADSEINLSACLVQLSRLEK